MTHSLPLPHPHPDPIRVVAWGLAITINLSVALLFSLPGEPTVELPVPPPVTPDPITAVDIRQLEPVPMKPVPALPMPPDRPPRPSPAPSPTVVEHAAMPIPVDRTAAPVRPSLPAPTVDMRVAEPATQVAYRFAPPPLYPSAALRRGLEGTVLLRVLVGSDGLARQVEVHDSSGHGLLDSEARDQVLQRWRFAPAMQRGQPVEAWVEIPVSFELPR